MVFVCETIASNLKIDKGKMAGGGQQEVTAGKKKAEYFVYCFAFCLTLYIKYY
jgi:hypothetical protein